MLYQEDSLQQGKLWDPQPANDKSVGEVMVPLLLSILLVLFRSMQAEGRQLMPHDVHAYAMARVEGAPDIGVANNNWSLIPTDV